MLNRKNITKLSNTIIFKIGTIFILGLLLLIPTFFILDVVKDRKNYQEDAIESVLTPIGGNLQIDGILMVIPYRAKTVHTNGVVEYYTNYSYIMPQNYSIDGDVDVTILERSIYSVPTFSSDLKVKGHFKQYDGEDYDITDNAFFIVGTKSKKSFTKIPNIKINGESLEEYEASIPIRVSFFQDMFVFKLPENHLEKGFDFEADFNVQGGGSIFIRPLKSENKFSLTSKWADPSFSGGWIPTERNVSKDGFSATWDVAHFHTTLNSSWSTSSYSGYSNEDSFYDNVIRISFMLLNDNYQKTTKSIKYAILFIFIPFLVLLLCELLSKKSLHIIQYGLIGFANVIFFLLLLSISEHMSFNISYILGATMVTFIVSSYVGYIMKSKKLGLTMAGVQFFAYVFLFITLQLSTYSLLLGSLGLFISLALAMYLTRNIDWSSPMASQQIDDSSNGEDK